MFAKMLAIILTFGAVACLLLVHRQQRVEAAHEMTKSHRRIQEHERVLWELRAEIAELARPERIRDAQQRLPGEWLPLALELDRQEREDAHASVGDPVEDRGG